MLCAERLRVLLGGPLLHLGLDSWLLNLYRWLDAEYELQGDGCRASIDALVRLIFLRVIRLADRDISAIDACPGPDNRGSRAEKLLSDCCSRESPLTAARYPPANCVTACTSAPLTCAGCSTTCWGMPPSSAFIRSVRMREAEIHAADHHRAHQRNRIRIGVLVAVSLFGRIPAIPLDIPDRLPRRGARRTGMTLHSRRLANMAVMRRPL